MKLLSVALFVLLQIITFLGAFSIDETPVCSIYTPNSILNRKKDFYTWSLGSRERYSTCSGVTWFHDCYLAVLNLFGRKIDTYKFDVTTMTVEHLQEINNELGARFTSSENLVVSPDESLLAVCSDGPEAGVKIYSVDLKTHRIDPKPACIISTNDMIHSVRFTPDGQYLLVAGFCYDEAVVVYKVIKTPTTIECKRVYQQPGKSKQLKAKGINVTRDGRFVIVVYCVCVGDSSSISHKWLLEVYTFDSVSGRIGSCVDSSQEGNPSSIFEDVVFIDNDRMFILSDQCNDFLSIYAFDPKLGKIGSSPQIFHGDKTGLSFPHGIGVSSDGKFLAVTNYGDDKLNVYRLS